MDIENCDSQNCLHKGFCFSFVFCLVCLIGQWIYGRAKDSSFSNQCTPGVGAHTCKCTNINIACFIF